MEQNLTEKIEQLNARRTTLRDSVIRAQTNAETAQNELKRLEQEAKEKFGTSDPVELEKLLAQWTEENQRSVQRYEENLLTVEKELRQMQQQLNQN